VSTDTTRDIAPDPSLADACRLFAEEWLACTIRAYPEHFGGLLRGAGSPFRNPVGSTLRTALGGLTDELFGGFDRRRATALVDSVVRLRVVQDCSPAEVTSFVALARRAAARVAETGSPGVGPGLLDLVHERIAELSHIAEACLMTCREDLRMIAARSARRRVFVTERIQARAAARAAGRVASKPPAPRSGTP
jgi:hypothetical protein